MNNDGYDVIIAGAGPGGLECAAVLKDSGLRVLVIERKKSIGPKICAGGITRLVDIDLPDDRCRSFTSELYTIGNDDRVRGIPLRQPVRTITRPELGRHQLQKIAGNPDITILTETSVTRVSAHAVTTGKGVFSYRYLVGADGSASVVRRYLKLPCRYCIGLYYESPTMTDSFRGHLDPKRLRSGYIWEFPHMDHTNVGVYYDPDQLSRKVAYSAFENYLRKRCLSYDVNKLFSAPVPYTYAGCVFGNIFLIGDAAGLALRSRGEGITTAIGSGREIARKILDPNYSMQALRRLVDYKNNEDNRLRAHERVPFKEMQLRLFLYLKSRGAFQLPSEKE